MRSLALFKQPLKRFFLLISFFSFLFPWTKANSQSGPLNNPPSPKLMLCGRIFLKTSTPSNRTSSNPSRTLPDSTKTVPLFLRADSPDTFFISSPGSVVINYVKKVLGKNFPDRTKDNWVAEVQSSFRNWKTEDVEEFLTYMESRTGEEHTVNHLLNSPSYFSLSGYRTFRDKVFLFDEYIGENRVTEILRESPEVFFTEVPFSELRQVVTFIEVYYLGKDAVKRKMREDPSALLNLRISHLEKLERELRHTELRTRLMEWSFGRTTLVNPEIV